MNKDKDYILNLNNEKKIKLDILIDKFSAFTVGNGYIDIIIPRENISIFIEGLTILEIAIEAVSWWCNATDNNKKENGCPHGYGGPITKYGWFTEMCHDFDEIEKEVLAGLDNNCNHKLIKDINDKVKQIIENKQTVKNAEGLSLKYNSNSCLTPALWLYVADDWVR